MPSESKAKIRVALFDLGRQWRGGQRQSLNLAIALKRAGIPVELFCSQEGALSRMCPPHQIKVHPTSYHAFSIVFAARRIGRLLAKGQFEIVHASDSHSHTLGLLIKRFYPRVKVVVTSRTCLGGNRIMSRRLKYGSAAVARYVAISQAVRLSLIQKSVAEKKIDVIQSGIDRDYFRCIQRKAHDSLIIGTACALERSKGVDQIIRALAKIKNDLGEFSFRIAGQGPDRNKLRHLGQTLGLQNQIEFLGFVEDMAGFYNSLDLYVLASYSEGLGTSLLEAAACGAVPMGTKVGGISEIIEDGKTGFLFEAGDSDHLAEIILLLKRNPELQNKVRNALEISTSKFDINNVCSRYLEVYKRALKDDEREQS